MKPKRIYSAVKMEHMREHPLSNDCALWISGATNRIYVCSAKPNSNSEAYDIYLETSPDNTSECDLLMAFLDELADNL